MLSRYGQQTVHWPPTNWAEMTIMKRWMLWVLMIMLLLVAVILFIWSIQTAWLGSFPGKDKSKYALWAALEFGGGLALTIAPIVLWVRCRHRSARPR